MVAHVVQEVRDGSLLTRVVPPPYDIKFKSGTQVAASKPLNESVMSFAKAATQNLTVNVEEDSMKQTHVGLQMLSPINPLTSSIPSSQPMMENFLRSVSQEATTLSRSFLYSGELVLLFFSLIVLKSAVIPA